MANCNTPSNRTRCSAIRYSSKWVIDRGSEIDHYQPLLFELVDELERWMLAGKLFHVAPGLPEVNPGDLRSFLDAGKAA